MASQHEMREQIEAMLRSEVRVMTVRELIDIGKACGWEEDIQRGNGSHRCLVREGYALIVLKFHGNSTEVSKNRVRDHLERIVQPLRDEGVPAEKMEALLNRAHEAVEYVGCHYEALALEQLDTRQADIEAKLLAYERQRTDEIEAFADLEVSQIRDRKFQQVASERDGMFIEWERATERIELLDGELQHARAEIEQNDACIVGQKRKLEKREADLLMKERQLQQERQQWQQERVMLSTQARRDVRLTWLGCIAAMAVAVVPSSAVVRGALLAVSAPIVGAIALREEEDSSSGGGSSLSQTSLLGELTRERED